MCVCVCVRVCVCVCVQCFRVCVCGCAAPGLTEVRAAPSLRARHNYNYEMRCVVHERGHDARRPRSHGTLGRWAEGTYEWLPGSCKPRRKSALARTERLVIAGQHWQQVDSNEGSSTPGAWPSANSDAG
jgi:hypothetical protein